MSQHPGEEVKQMVKEDERHLEARRCNFPGGGEEGGCSAYKVGYGLLGNS